MALVRFFTVSCDVCKRRFNESSYDSQEVRREAKRVGWVRVPRGGGPTGRGVDLCPADAHRKEDYL